MNLGDLKKFIKSLPKDMDDFELVNGEIGEYEDDKLDNVYYKVDKPIILAYADHKNKELCFCHQTREDVQNFINGTTEGPE